MELRNSTLHLTTIEDLKEYCENRALILEKYNTSLWLVNPYSIDPTREAILIAIKSGDVFMNRWACAYISVDTVDLFYDIHERCHIDVVRHPLCPFDILIRFALHEKLSVKTEALERLKQMDMLSELLDE